LRRIGVISDTHGQLRPEAVAALEGSDLILHAGDVGDPDILDRLARIGPVHAVHGNTDYGELLRFLPATTVVDLGAPDGALGPDGPRGPVAYVLHDLDALHLDPVAAGFSLVVTGHTHEPKSVRRDGVLYLNPGSAGPRRFNLPVSVARVTVGFGEPDVEIVRLNVGEGR
jgi:putative phosphoesterase